MFRMADQGTNGALLPGRTMMSWGRSRPKKGGDDELPRPMEVLAIR